MQQKCYYYYFIKIKLQNLVILKLKEKLIITTSNFNYFDVKARKHEDTKRKVKNLFIFFLT